MIDLLASVLDLGSIQLSLTGIVDLISWSNAIQIQARNPIQKIEGELKLSETLNQLEALLQPTIPHFHPSIWMYRDEFIAFFFYWQSSYWVRNKKKKIFPFSRAQLVRRDSINR